MDNLVALSEAELARARQHVEDIVRASGTSFFWAMRVLPGEKRKAMFAGFAPTKAAQRILAESMARDLGPKGVHVGYVMIDAVIDLEWTRKRFAGQPDEFFCQPDDIATAVWDLTHQKKSAWAFEMEIRPFGETW